MSLMCACHKAEFGKAHECPEAGRYIGDIEKGEAMSDKCMGIWGALFGHKFEPRYNETESPTNSDNVTGAKEIVETIVGSGSALLSCEIASIMDSFCICKSEYIHDVCVRCGKIAQKETK